ncbi:hypothetical protein M0812_01873 [Anaeramoeba flamelloides]|uniref:Uncharacterized protein n=1 Tax=Anaeramoeba flamelloides TaxID=1746091 RepID=A0AAV7Z1B2_9EUKA|nr:hypothetical protein M0812_01873 [Anaeramoeba flamelloides]
MEQWKSLPGFNSLGDGGGWGKPQYYNTILTNVIGQDLYVWGRGYSTFHFYKFDTKNQKWKSLPGIKTLGDEGGWSNPKYYSTIRTNVIGQDLYVWGRGYSAFHLYKFDTKSQEWIPLPGFDSLGDKEGWGDPKYYSTIQTNVIGQDLYVWGRGSSKFHLYVFDAKFQDWTSLPGINALSDKEGWGDPKYYSTIRTNVIGQDLYVWGRGSSTFHFYKFHTQAQEWIPLPGFSSLSDEGGWGDPKYYSTIQTNVIGQDLYVWGRGSSTFHFYKFDTQAQQWIPLPGFSSLSDKGGWSKPKYYSTIKTNVIGQDLYVWGRGSSTFHFYKFDTQSQKWISLHGFNSLGDQGGWGDPKYYSTLRTNVIGQDLYVWGRGSSTFHFYSYKTKKNIIVPTEKFQNITKTNYISNLKNSISGLYHLINLLELETLEGKLELDEKRIKKLEEMYEISQNQKEYLWELLRK